MHCVPRSGQSLQVFDYLQDRNLALYEEAHSRFEPENS